MIIIFTRYDEEQKQLRKAFLRSLEDAGSGEEEEDETVLKVKAKTKEEEEEEALAYDAWLSGQGSKLDTQTREQIEPLRRFWTDPNLSSNDLFLRDYITKQLWKPREHVATVHNPAPVSDSEDEEALEEAERFEKKFNFRFEEEEGTQVGIFNVTVAVW